MEYVIAAIMGAMIIWGLIEVVQTIRRWEKPVTYSDRLVVDQTTLDISGDLAEAVTDATVQVTAEAVMSEKGAGAIGHVLEGMGNLLHH
jgi:hypothetical protein